MEHQFDELAKTPAEAGVAAGGAATGERNRPLLGVGELPPGPPPILWRATMSHRALLLAWLIAGSLGLPLPGFAADVAPPAPSILEGARELDRAVSYTETKIPLGELIRRVAADTGVPLTAAPDVADEPVAVVVQALPARELLEQLADLLAYRWRRWGREGAWRYEIWQDLAGKQREAALRQALAAAVERRFRQELGGYLAIAALTPAQIRAIVTAGEAQERARAELPAAQRDALLHSPEEQARSRRLEIARELSAPLPRTLARLLGLLPPPQWARLREGYSLVFSTEPQPGELPLPGDTEQALRAASGGPARDGSAGHRVTIRLDDDRSTWGALDLIATAVPLPPAPPASGRGAPASPSAMPGATLYVSTEPVDLAELVPDTPERRAALARDPVLGLRKRFQPEGRARVRPSGGGSGPEGRLLRDLLPDLARTYGVQFLSDAYASGPRCFGAPWAAGVPTPLFELLDRLAGSEQRWDCRGKLVRLRSRTWFLERPGEVPLRFVRRWQGLGRPDEALPLEAYLEMATLLTDRQLESLAELVWDAELPKECLQVDRARHALRLYAALGPGQRQALWHGQRIAFAQMTPPQRALFAAALGEWSRSQSWPVDPVEVAAGSLSLVREALVRTPAPGLGAVRSLSEQPATPGGGSGRLPPAPARPRLEPNGRTPAPAMRLRLDLRCGSQWQASVSLVVVGPS